MVIKLLSILLAVVILGGVFIVYNTDATYNFGKFTIEKKTLDDFSDKVVGEFILCNMEKDKCIMVEKINKKEFEGPVRPTDDEEHFRETGETIPKEGY